MKRIVLKAISILLVVIAIFALYLTLTVTGGGFLDLSNIVRGVCLCISVLCAILAVITWKCSKPKQ